MVTGGQGIPQEATTADIEVISSGYCKKPKEQKVEQKIFAETVAISRFSSYKELKGKRPYDGAVTFTALLRIK